MIDNATRSPFLTFLPFLLIAKGLTVAGVGGAFALLFAGGAVGKFACGLLAERIGVIRAVVLTEAVTAIGIVTVVAAPLGVALAVLPVLGVALNGTSSVLYGTVADLVSPERRARAYGLYYTLSIGASALAPSLYGMVSDSVGVPATLTVIGAARARHDPPVAGAAAGGDGARAGLISGSIPRQRVEKSHGATPSSEDGGVTATGSAP